MIREQSILKVAGNEIPLIAFDDWKVWVFFGVILAAIWIWKR